MLDVDEIANDNSKYNYNILTVIEFRGCEYIAMLMQLWQ